MLIERPGFLAALLRPIGFHFSKLTYFTNNYPVNTFEQKKVINDGASDFSLLLRNLKGKPTSQANNELLVYFQQRSAARAQLLELLLFLQKTNFPLLQTTRELFAQHLTRCLKSLNFQEPQDFSFIITLGQYALQTNTIDDEFTKQLFSVILKADLQNSNISQIIDLAFVLVITLKRLPKDEIQEAAFQFWTTLLRHIEDSLEREEQIFIKRYPHIAQALRTLFLEIPQQKFDLELTERIFMKITQAFLRGPVSNYDSKDTTILLISVQKLLAFRFQQPESHSWLRMVQGKVISELTRLNLNGFTDHALNSLTLSLTQLPEKQIEFQRRILDSVENMTHQPNFQYKFLLSILYEIYFKWQKKPGNYGQLEKILPHLKLQQCSFFDMAHFCQLLTICSGQVIQAILSQPGRFKEIQELCEKLKQKDALSSQRIKKSMHRILGRLQEDQLENQQIAQQIQKIIALLG